MTSIGDIEFEKVDGTTGRLGDHAGDVVLVVNVASKCGLTPQYEGLQALYEGKQADGLTILGFPANDFAGQEPGTDAEIAEFCSTQYSVTFPVASKISVVGDDQHPLYASLTEAVPTAEGKGDFRETLRGHGLSPTDDPDVLWNFEKFLISREGEVVARFAPSVAPDDPALVAAVDAELARVTRPAVRAVSSPARTERDGTADVDAYLAELPAAQQAALGRVRATLRRILPHASEGLRYGMPAVVLDGKGIAGYGAFKDHCGYFPMSGAVVDRAADALSGYERSKGGFRFGVDQRLPVGLVRQLVQLRVAELASVEDGKRTEYYADGQLKAVGPMKDGQLHGRWRWYRRDGTLLRTGQLSHGEQVGTWTTWDRDGTAAKTTHV